MANQGLALTASYATGSTGTSSSNGPQVKSTDPVWLGTDLILVPSGVNASASQLEFGGSAPILQSTNTAHVGSGGFSYASSDGQVIGKDGKPENMALTMNEGEGNLNQGRSGRGSTPYTVGQVQAQWYAMSLGQQKAIASKLFALGYIQNPGDLDGAQNTLNGAIAATSLMYQLGQQVSPLEYLSNRAASVNAPVLAARKQVGPGGLLTSTHVNVADPEHAKAIATNALQTALGRMPTSFELNTFYNSLVAKEKADPTVSSAQVVGYDSAGNPQTDNNAVTHAGFGSSDADIQGLLQDQIQNNPEARALQAATTYLGALQQALSTPGGVGRA